MIKIDINAEIKKEIEKAYLNDACKAKSGIFNLLCLTDVKKNLQKHYIDIYSTLYDSVTGDLNETEVHNLLLADRQELKNYISKFGIYGGNKKRKSDYLLKHVFRYDTYSKRKCVCQILRLMNVTVCPYCNRQYIHTIASGKARPQLDHYYPKHEYPYLALSLYNMVPSCSICNMSKSSLDTVKEPILYPFDEEFGYDAKFKIFIKYGEFAKVMQGLSEEFVIELDTTQVKDAVAVNNQIKKLHLEELYNLHTDYVKDILKSKYVNTPERIDEIRKLFPHIFNSDDEIKGMLYMSDLQKEFWGKRPLSKLTYDIDKQLDSNSLIIIKNSNE